MATGVVIISYTNAIGGRKKEREKEKEHGVEFIFTLGLLSMFGGLGWLLAASTDFKLVIFF